MADLKAIVCVDQAKPVPATIPDRALVLIEIDKVVYKMSFADLAAEVISKIPPATP